MSKPAGVNKTMVEYERRFDLGNFQSLVLSVTIWANVLDPEQLHLAQTLLWGMAKDAVKHIVLRELRQVYDDSLLITPEELEDVAQIETVSVSLAKKQNTEKRYENANVSSKLWYSFDPEDKWTPVITALWSTCLNNVSHGLPGQSNDLPLGLNKDGDE